jgi:hypothetical protein
MARKTDGEVRDMKRHSLRLRNSRNPSQYHMKTCHKGKLSNRNVGSNRNICKIHVYAIQFILKVQRVLYFLDGTRSIF